MSPDTTQIPVVIRTSQATRPVGSSFRTASSTESEIWSAILSGCPSVTDSDVKMCRIFSDTDEPPENPSGNSNISVYQKRGSVSRFSFFVSRSARRIISFCSPYNNGVYSSLELRSSLLDARRRTLELVSDLSDQQLAVPEIDIVNPPIWEMGHLALFQERWE